ncbi:MAG: ATP-grasp domain-containing protein [Patescibacteria group bacterium]
MKDELKIKSGLIIFIANDLDSDDFFAITNNLEFRDNILIVCDKKIKRESDTREFNCLVSKLDDVPKLVKKITAWAKKNHKLIVGVIGLDEEYHYAVSKNIAKEFSLEFYGDETIDNTSNKYLQRKKLRNARINVPNFQLIELNSKINIPFPNVLKVLTGNAGFFVYHNKNQEDFKKNIKDFSFLKNKTDLILQEHKTQKETYDPKKQFIIEEYVAGQEYSCDYLISDKQAHILRVSKKINSQEAFAFTEAIALINPDISKEGFKTKQLAFLCKKVAHALNINHGVCMMDFMVKDKKLVVLETSIRPGISTFIDLMAELYRDTSINQLIRQKLKLQTIKTMPKKEGLVVYFTTKSPGKIRLFDTDKLKKIKPKLKILKICKYYKKGDLVKIDSNHPEDPIVLGYVLLKGAAELNIKLVQTNTNIQIYAQ